ncbi:MAG: IPT/TIG domain-containing protein [Spirochaetes bacterium]|nr:IPT/TIG domain-containing protein [Spirochaetota bacterium]
MNRLNGVSALDATHVWAVGDNGTILFFNGTSWSPQDSGSTCHLHGISARTATDAWAVGFRSTVLHYNGTDWSPVDATTIGGTPHPDESLTSVCALGAQDVWVTSLSFFTSLLHYNGTGWAKITSKSDTFYSAAGINGDKIWAVGQNGKINFYNGSVSSLQSQSVKEIRAISSSDADNTWAVGSAGTILHYNGADWAAQTSGVTTDLYGVSALNADRAWAVGKISTILRWDGLNWSTQESHLLEDTKLMAVAALDENQVWAVGENGVILKYNGLDWNLQDSGTALWLFGVTARDSGNVWAVGEGGTILRYDGAVWCPSESGTYNSLYAVSSTEDGQAWAVGANGTVVRWDGSAWSMQDSGTMKSLRAVYAIGPNDVWAAGGDGALLHWDGTAWRSKPYGHHDNSWYYGVSASDTNNVVAVGSVSFSMGLILRHKTPTVASTLGDEMPNVSEASVDAYLPASLRPGASLPPGRVDLSSELPPVQNQTMDFYPGSSMCGNFSAGYYLFTQWVKHFKRLDWDLTKPEHWMSAMFMFFIGGGGNQGNVKAALTTNGGVDMTEVPFNPEGYGPEAPSDAQREAAMAFKVQDYVAVWDNGAAMPPYAGNDIEAAKARLASGYVLCVEIGTQSGDFPDNQLNPPSLYYDPVLAPYNINHFAVLCGYDDNINPSGADADHRGGFLLVNMWGDAWNGPMHGYLWVSYAWVKHCVSTCYYILGDGPNGPAISGCSTTSAAVGDSVTISGSGFGCLRRKAKVKFNGTPAQCTSFKNNSIIVTVPSGATSGPLIVYDYEGTASNQISFDVLH